MLRGHSSAGGACGGEVKCADNGYGGSECFRVERALSSLAGARATQTRTRAHTQSLHAVSERTLRRSSTSPSSFAPRVGALRPHHRHPLTPQPSTHFPTGHCSFPSITKARLMQGASPARTPRSATLQTRSRGRSCPVVPCRDESYREHTNECKEKRAGEGQRVSVSYPAERNETRSTTSRRAPPRRRPVRAQSCAVARRRKTHRLDASNDWLDEAARKADLAAFGPAARQKHGERSVETCA